MTSSPEYVREPDSAKASKVWAAMAEMFGNTFLTQYGEKPPSVWVLQVNQLRDDEIRNGLNNLAEANLSFPPNLSQFVSACKKAQPSQTGYWGSMPKLEDLRTTGHMSYAEWKQKNVHET